MSPEPRVSRKPPRGPTDSERCALLTTNMEQLRAQLAERDRMIAALYHIADEHMVAKDLSNPIVLWTLAETAAAAREYETRTIERCAKIPDRRMADCLHDGSPDAVSFEDDDGKHLNGCSRCWEDAEVAELIRALAPAEPDAGKPA